ncbi:protein OCTOPUS [Prosopis cineraria]|uniref:protein OCTOPUS n=1 Tax=Prosopis cineraria TaxID=364024 RepID=UPI0024104125|nr:protein OCTOPUS [Prosopis cineraria]
MNPPANPTAPPPPPPAAAAPPPLLPPQPPLQPHRPSTSCDRHPEEHFTGFCPICLCERLAVLDPNSSTASSSSARKPPISSTAAAALKAIFKPSSVSGAGGRSNRPPSSSSFLPELRRTKSFSASKNEGFSGVFEPQRKSCDVRVRSTLWNLFHQDNERNPFKKEASRTGSGSGEAEAETKNLASSSVQGPVIESQEEEEDEIKEENVEEKDEEEDKGEDEDEDGIRVLEEPNSGNVIENRVQEIVEEEELEEELKTMKDHIDLDSQAKKTSGGRHLKEIAGSFWSAASVFSKKLQKWRHKQKMKKHRGGGGSATLPVEKPIGKQFRETQSEIADYGFGRRSCDTDPRFSLDIGRMSLDAGRISFDDPRYSFDEPRASWDGYLIGRTVPRMPPMLSVVEDAPVHVLRSDTQIPVEEPMNAINEGETVPGGSTQTREYYSDSSSRRRKSLDRSNSVRKTAAAVVAEMDELKSASNAKVTPATSEYVHPKMVLPDRILRDSNSNSLRDDCSDQTFELGFGDTASVIGAGDQKGSSKKSRRWSKGWNIWGLINRRGGNKDEEEDRYSRTNGTERSFSESWHDLGSERIRDTRNGFNPKVLRSNSSVSWRNGHSMNGSFGGSMRKNGFHGSKGRDNRDEFVLERNRSARYSTSDADNGLWRFYLTPMRVGGGWRNVGSSGKTKSNQAQSIARSVLRLY